LPFFSVDPPVPAHRAPLRLSFSVVLAILGGCALSPPSEVAAAAEPEPKPPTAASPELQSPSEQAQFHIMAGEMAAGRQLPQTAAEEFMQALDFVPDAKLAARATALALAANDEPLALTAARKWLSIEKNSLDAREVITRLALRSGLDDEAYDQCAAIVRDHPGGIGDGFRHVALLIAQEPDHRDAALALMAKLVAQYPKQVGAWQAQGLLALRFNQVELAERSAREALRIQPQSKEAALLLTGALVKKGDIAGADQVMDGVVKNNTAAADLRMGYVRLLLESNQRPQAREQLRKILAVDPDNADAHFAVGLLALDERKLDEAEPHFVLVAKTGAKAGEHALDAEYYLGRIAELRHQPQEAYDHYEKVVSGNQALDAALRRASMLAKLGKLQEARDTLDALRHQFPPLADRFYAAEGEILMDANDNEAAIDLFNQALSQLPGNADLLYSRSLAFERAGRTDLAEADLQALLDQSPNDARALNALGYMLTVHTTRYDEAEKLVTRALEISPDEPAAIDSLGWLRYRQGRNAESLDLLQKAYAEFPDAEIAAHLGEVLWTTGDKDKARAVWAEAGKSDPDNSVLRETVKRLNP
jgi:tetratricopeptide (TPR) repeat protein